MSAAASPLGAIRRVLNRRRGLVLLDQAASSGSNVIVAVLAARSLGSAAAFGAFSLAVLAYQLSLSVVRSLVGEPWLALYSNEPHRAREPLVSEAQGATFFIGALASVALVALSVALGGLSGSALGAVALPLPFMLVQDTWRFVFAGHRPGAMLALDVLWLTIIVAVIPFAPDDAGVAWFVVVWGVGGACGAVLGLVLNAGWAGWPHPWRWVVRHREISLRFLGESTTAHVLGHVLMTALGAIVGLAALGAVRVTQVFYGPLNMLYAGIYLAVVPEGALLRDRPQELERKVRWVSMLLMAVVVPVVALGVMLPDDVGRSLFGRSWDAASDLMLPMGISAVASAAISGGLVGLRSLADAKRSLAARLRVSPILVACPLVGAITGGATGFAIGTALGTSLSAVIWWRAFGDALAAILARQAEAGEPPSSVGPLTAVSSTDQTAE